MEFDAKRQRSLKWGYADGSGYAVMMGFGETYFIPLMLFIGATNFQLGFFASAPQLFFAFAQFAGLYLVEKFMVRKQVMATAAGVQSLFLLVAAWMVWSGVRNPWLYTLAAIGYFSANGMTLPAWNSLIGDLMIEGDRGGYLGRRMGLSQMALFGSVLAAGLILRKFDATGQVHIGFAIILALAFTGRAVSVTALTRHFEVPYKLNPDSYFSFQQFVRRSGKSNFARFVFLVALMNFAVQMAAPYFVAYMIRDLEFGFFKYTIAQGVFVVVQYIAMRRWGPFADRFGNRVVLSIAGTMLGVIPLLWFLTSEFKWILLLQVVGGLAWAGWMLSTTNFIFDAVTPPKRARCAAFLNFFNSIGFFCGALLGAFISTHAPHSVSTGAMTIVFLSPLEFVFLASSAIRFMVLLVFLPMVYETRRVSQTTKREMFAYLMNVRPLTGGRYTPFTGWKRKEEKQETEDEQ